MSHEQNVRVTRGGATAIGGVVTAAIASNFWIKWTEVAVEHARVAREARERAVAPPDGGQRIGEAFDDELKAALVAVTAGAFAIDAWYIAVKDMVTLPAHMITAWRGHGPPSRAAQITETLKVGFALGPVASRWGRDIRQLFAHRTRAVHHESVFYETQPHPTGKSHVSMENVTYSAEAAAHAADLAIEVVTVCIGTPRLKFPDLVKWCDDQAHVPPSLADTRRKELGR